jgi:crotonobetainyl-CoA:carnitine CoA-transferase CaiB-like acyl-CoA transferase
MAGSALSELKVVELGGFIAAPYCTKLMADLGAEVIKVEEPGKGDPARSYGPFPNDDPHPERSLLFAYLNTNKLGVTLDVKSPLGRRVFKELLRDTDVLVESNPPKTMNELGLDYDSLAGVNPRLIVTSITPFGQSGPYRDYAATDLVLWHMGGTGYVTPGDVEDPDTHPPLNAPQHQPHIMSGITAAAATMTAVFARGVTGRGQHVDISEQEALVRTLGGAVVSHVNRGETPTRIAGLGLPTAGGLRFLRARDGYFLAIFFQDNHWKSLKKALGYPAWMESEIFNDGRSRRDNHDAVYALIEDWSKDYTRDQVCQILQVENRVPCFPVNTMAEVLTHPHFQERGTFVDMEHPNIGKFKAPGLPYNFSETPGQTASPAPTLGQHNKGIICARLGYSSEDLVRMFQMGVV